MFSSSKLLEGTLSQTRALLIKEQSSRKIENLFNPI